MAALAAFALGKLDAPAAETIHNHLADCADCRTVVETTPNDTLMGLFQKVAAMPGDTPSLGASMQTGTWSVPNPVFDASELPPELRDHPRYRIVRKLGQGGMGAVYLAEHKMMERVVAIKVIAAGFVDSPEAIERFQREVRAAAKLEHAHIVRAYDADQAGSAMLLAMEFVKGRTLAEVVARRGPLPVAYACQCVRQAAHGLQHAYENGMVHRDIKPQYLMLAEKGTVKILDFGLAKLISERVSRPGLTGEDIVMGTPEYMAPEQARDTASADIRADIYALGCTLFYMLTGRPPFTGATALEIVTKQVVDAPQQVTDLRPEVPAALADLIGRMLAKKPQERPQTPREVADGLKAFTKKTAQGVSLALPAVGSPFADIVAGPSSPFMARRRGRHSRWPLPVAAGAIMTAIVVATVIWLKTSDGYVLVEVPDGAQVQVDGEVITAQPYRITVDAKDRKLVVLKDGVEIHSESISIKDKGRTIVATMVAAPQILVQAPATAPQFVPLFNGKDLDGWARRDGEWRVQDGLLFGQGIGIGHPTTLATVRNDFRNFHFRARFLHLDNKMCFINVRHGPSDDKISAYRIAIGGGGGTNEAATRGSIKRVEGEKHPTWGSADSPALASHIGRNVRFDLEIVAEDAVIRTLVNHVQVAEYRDMKEPFRTGRISVTCRGDAAIQIVSIDIKELP
jgi:predicted Ser/Thr protein kinase